MFKYWKEIIPSPVALKTHRVASSCSRTTLSPISRFRKHIILISRYPVLVHYVTFSPCLFYYAANSLCGASFTCRCWHSLSQRVWIHKGTISTFTKHVLLAAHTSKLRTLFLHHRRHHHHILYTVSQKTSPTFLAITRESIDGFL